MMRYKRLLAAALVGCLLLAVTGCAQGATADDGGISNEQNSGSPLEPYLGFILGFGHTDVESRAIFELRARSEEEFVARCMHNQGFEYLPYLGTHSIPRTDGSIWRRDDAEWVSAYGYGIFKTTPEFGSHYRITPAGWGEIAISDPNFDVLASLAAPEAQAWNAALWGVGSPTVAENLGCRDLARQYAHDLTPTAVLTRAEFATIFDLWIDMLWEVDAEVEANHDWAVCMSEAGFGDFTRQRDAEESIRGHVSAETGHLHGEWEWRVQQLRPEVAEELRQLELETAVADLNCRISTDFHARVAAHQFEVESAFVARYGPALEEVRLAAEQSGLTWLPEEPTQAEQ